MLAVLYGLDLARLQHPPPIKAIAEYTHGAPDPRSEPTSLAKETEKEREPDQTIPLPAGIQDVRNPNLGDGVCNPTDTVLPSVEDPSTQVLHTQEEANIMEQVHHEPEHDLKEEYEDTVYTEEEVAIMESVSDSTRWSR